MSKTRKSFPLRISQELYDNIKRWSDEEMRSVNGQIEYLLRQAVLRRKGDDAGSAEEESEQSAE